MNWFKTTIDDVVADIDRKVTQLGVIAEAKKLEAEAHDEVVKVRTELGAFARAEEARIKAIAAEFKALIAKV
jgi:hypothetical protein